MAHGWQSMAIPMPTFFTAVACINTTASMFPTWGVDLQTMSIVHYVEVHRRRELAQNKAEPGKNWNSFETFIFITLRVSSYKINQDPGREKSGRHFFRPFSRWPPLKIAKIKNKHNFDIIEPRKVILVSNSMFLSMIYSLVHLKMHFEVTWPEIQYGRHLNPLDMHWLKNTWWFLCSKCCPFGNIL